MFALLRKMFPGLATYIFESAGFDGLLVATGKIWQVERKKNDKLILIKRLSERKGRKDQKEGGRRMDENQIKLGKVLGIKLYKFSVNSFFPSIEFL